MKRLFLFILTLATGGAFAQNIVPIQQIQGWAGQFQPDSCSEGPNPAYLGQTVTVRGVVITSGGLNETTGQTRWIWIRDVSALPSTPFGNISVRSSAATTPTDINSLIAGDTIQVTGQVQEFQGTGGTALNGETQLAPEPGGVVLISESPGPAPAAFPVSVAQLNGPLNTNDQPSNRITTGEPLEGNFVEISNVTVTFVETVSGRCRIRVRDENNNQIWIYDRFKTQRISTGFVPPNVGDNYISIKGIIEGWKNICPGTAVGNRGYNLNPFSPTHYVKGASAPVIGNIRKSVACPGATSPTLISADITDDGSVASAELVYTTADDFNNPTVVAMTVVGTRYVAPIEGQPSGSLVRYYIRARDNLNNTTSQPNVPAQATPLFFTVNNNGCTIRDIQFTPFSTGRSGYVGDSVTVQGVVTASASPNNLGYVYIQEPNQSLWAGIWINGGSLISGFNVGDRVSVSGVVEESFGLTRITNVYGAVPLSTGQPVPPPVVINPADFSIYDFVKCEPYEGMLVRLENPISGQGLFVVDTNADASQNRNNGEYRVGGDVQDPNTGVRILAGRQTTSAFSSLNVSYVNSPLWATTDGIMNVPPIVVLPASPVTLMQGILTFSFGNMKVLPRDNSDVAITVSAADRIGRSQAVIMPNPASSGFRIQLPDEVAAAGYTLVNAQGRAMNSGTVTASEGWISVESLPPGIYKIRLTGIRGEVLTTRTLSVVR
jgi:hypothetical protein